MVVFINEIHRLPPRRRIEKECASRQPVKYHVAYLSEPLSRHLSEYDHGSTKTIPFRHSHLLWPVSGLTSDPPCLPMHDAQWLLGGLHGDPCACLPLRGQHTLAKAQEQFPACAPCFPFNCPSEPTGGHQNCASVGKVYLYVNVNRSDAL